MSKQDKVYGHHIDRDPDEIVAAFSELGNRAAVAHTQLKYLEDLEKIRFAEIKLEIWEADRDEKGRRLANTTVEMMALADPRYREHIEKLRTARLEAEKSSKAWKVEDKRLEIMRSLESSVKEQLRVLQG